MSNQLQLVETQPDALIDSTSVEPENNTDSTITPLKESKYGVQEDISNYKEMDEELDSCVHLDSDSSTSSDLISPNPIRSSISLTGTPSASFTHSQQRQDTDTSLEDTNEQDDSVDDPVGDGENSFPPRPCTPTPTRIRLRVSSPLSPRYAMRALQSGTPSPRKSDRHAAFSSPSPSPTGDKHAHQAKSRHYHQVRSKLRRDRERDRLMEKGTMGLTKLEDRRIRQRMMAQLQKNMRVPKEVMDVINAFLQQLYEADDSPFVQRLKDFTFDDIVDIWKFQYIGREEYIKMKGWSGTGKDDEAAIRYIISYCRHGVGMPGPGSPGG